MIIKLPQLDDLNRFLDENFRNEVFLITEDKPIKCNGAILAARSSILEGMIQDGEDVPVIEFSDNVPGLYSCLRMIYGGSVAIDEKNYKSVYKFGKFFQIKEMTDCVLKWVNEELPYSLFWEVSCELKKLGVSSKILKNAINRYCSENCDEFLQNTIRVCLNTNSSTGTASVKDTIVFDMFSEPNTISTENILTLLSDLLDAMTDKGQAVAHSFSMSSSVSNSTEIYVDCVVKTLISFLEKSNPCDFNSSSLVCTKYLEVLKKLSSVCNRVEYLRKISLLQNDSYLITLSLKEINFSPLVGLTRELVEKLTNPSTSYHTIRYFTEHAAKDIHPCIVGDIVLKWWTVKSAQCPDTSFIKTLFKKIEDFYDFWSMAASSDNRYYDLFQTLNLGGNEFTNAIHFYFDKDNGNLSALREYIERGDGTALTLPTWDIRCFGMETVMDKMSGFSYNPALFPPYRENDGYWFLFFRYKADSGTGSDSDFNFSMVSLITEYQQDILAYFDSCILGNLVFVPSLDTRLPQTNESLNKKYVIGK